MEPNELDGYEEIFAEIDSFEGAETPTSDFMPYNEQSREAVSTDNTEFGFQKFGEVLLIADNDLAIVCDVCSGKHFDLATFKEHVMQHYDDAQSVFGEEEQGEVSAIESTANTEVDFEKYISIAAVVAEPAQTQSEYNFSDLEEHLSECSEEERNDNILSLTEEEELIVDDEIDDENNGKITELTIEMHPELSNVLHNSNRSIPHTVGGEDRNLQVQCKACKQNFSTNFERQEHKCPETVDAPPGFVCEACGKKFKTRNACRAHQRTHIVRERYRCDLCENTYINKKTLIIHKRRHTGERPYGCMYCAEHFITSTALNKHLFKHTGVKPYECTDCDQSFATSMQLLNHSRIVHLDLRRFQCSACGKTFRTSTHLKAHYDSLHADLPRDKECEYCGALFKTVAHLKAHMLVHEDKKYKCPICSKAFAQYPGLYGHMKRHERSNATVGPGSRLRKMTANKSKKANP